MLAGAIADEPVGTSFEAHRRKLSARKLWIAFASRVAGTVTVDDGARRALVERQTSLLPAGVVDVAGRFGEGDTVDVSGTDGVPFARGMVFVEAAQLRRVAGRHTSDLPPGMVHEVIHRDDLVLAASLIRRVLERRRPTIGHSDGVQHSDGLGWGCSPAVACSTAGAPVSRPSSARSSLRRPWASMLAVACSTSRTRDSTDASVSSAVALALA